MDNNGKKMTKNRYTDDFLEFWVKYPSRWNRDSDTFYKVGKREAMDEWKKLNPEEKEQALLAVRHLRRGQYVLDAHRWLKKGRFDDYEPPEDKRPVLPKEMIDKVFKQAPRKEGKNEMRNKAMAKLASKKI